MGNVGATHNCRIRLGGVPVGARLSCKQGRSKTVSVPEMLGFKKSRKWEPENPELHDALVFSIFRQVPCCEVKQSVLDVLKMVGKGYLLEKIC